MSLTKKLLTILITASIFTSEVFADNDFNQAPVSPQLMPSLGAGEFGTDIDNQNNAGTNIADGDMDSYVYNTNTNHPIEYDIIIPSTQNPAIRSAILRMDVYDVDANATDPEVDKVFVNNTYVGTLTGNDSIWGVNYFNIPVGTLKAGRNHVRINVDTTHTSAYWAVQIDWGIIKFSATTAISRAWISPVVQQRGGYINVFAEIGGVPASVKVYSGSTYLFDLKDSDGDHIWSAAYQIPTSWTVGYKSNIFIKAFNSTGTVISTWPGMTVK